MSFLGFIGSCVVWLITYIGKFFVKSISGKLYLVGPLLVVMGSFYTAMSGFVWAVSSHAPPWLTQGLSLFIPYNLKFCVSLVWGARVTSTVYAHWREFVLASNQFRGE